MRGTIRLVGILYASLFLVWLIHLGLLLPAGSLKTYLRLPGVTDDLAWLVFIPLVGLLVSFLLVRRGRFWGAAMALILSIFLTVSRLVGYALNDFYFYRPALNGIKWPPSR